MPNKLILRLKNLAQGGSAIDWVVLHEDGNAETGVAANNSDLINQAEDAQQIFILVPSVDVLLTQAKLPKLSAQKLLKALPFALEDQLTEDATTMHFAVGDAPKGSALPIAVISKDKMSAWQQQFKDLLGIYFAKVKGVYPDVLAVPFISDGFQIVVDEQHALVRTGKQTGFMIEKDALFPVLQIMLKRMSAAKPGVIHVLTPNAEAVFSPEQIEKLHVPVQVEALPSSVNVFLAKSLDAPSALNILQGDFMPAQRKITFQQLIWACFILIGSWLVILTLVDFANFFLLHRERRILNNEMATIYAAIYPNKTLPDDPKAALQKELSSLRSSRSDSSFTRLLTDVGPSISKYTTQGLNLKGLSFKSNQLVLEVEAGDLTLMDKLRADLEAQGLKVIMSNAQRGTGGMTETRFTIEEMS